MDSLAHFNPRRVGCASGSAVRAGLGIPLDAFVVGFVGRVVKDKGIEEILTAWRLLGEETSRAHLIVVGPVETEDPIEPWAREALRKWSGIHYVGPVEDTAPFYAALDLLVLASHPGGDGFGMVVLEAAAMGVPAVVTRVTGLVDAVVDGVTGLIVPHGQAAALANALGCYLRDPSMRSAHGRTAQLRARSEFQPVTRWKALLAEY